MTTANANNPVNPLLGSSCGARKVCSISGFGDHRSEASGSGAETLRVLRIAKGAMTGFDSPNEATTSDNFRDPA